MTWTKKELLANPVEHVDITAFVARTITECVQGRFLGPQMVWAAEHYLMMPAIWGVQCKTPICQSD